MGNQKSPISDDGRLVGLVFRLVEDDSPVDADLEDAVVARDRRDAVDVGAERRQQRLREVDGAVQEPTRYAVRYLDVGHATR